MKTWLFLLAAFTAVLLTPLTHAAEKSVAGHWEGAIKLPNVELEILVDLEDAKGTIDIPAQTLRGFPLKDISTKPEAVAFSLPNIPGDPKFAGTLNAEGTRIEGKYTQGPNTYPFHLERKEKTIRPGETPSQGIPGEGFTGLWQGSLKVTLMELRLVLHLTADAAGKVTGTMDSLEQQARGIPISAGTAQDKKLSLKLDAIQGAFEGDLSADGSEIAGKWSQGGQSLPLVFRRIDKAPETGKAQEPKEPYPYASEDVKFENPQAKIHLAGTFTHPKSPGPHPAVILVSGSGPQDRDETVLGHRPFLVLADHLTRQGIAVLRYDDRGIGQSEGNFAAAILKDFKSDALAALTWLKTRPEVNPKKLGIAGHSEGGIIAPQVAVESADVAFIVLLAGVGVPMEDLMVRQGQDLYRAMGADAAMLKEQEAMQREIFRIMRTKGGAEEARAEIKAIIEKQFAKYSPEQRTAMGLTPEMLDGQAAMAVNPWFRDLLAYDPKPTLMKVKCPVLAICGTKDLQVACRENLEGIAAALKEGGNEQVKTVELLGLNHLFQTAKTGSVTEYASLKETFNPQAMDLISSWILEQTK